MPKLPGAEALGNPVSGRSGRPVATYDASAIGRGVAQLGAGIRTLGAGLEERQKKADAEVDRNAQFTQQSRFLEFEDKQRKALADSLMEAPVGAKDFSVGFKNRYQEQAREFFEQVPEELRPVYDQKLFTLESNLEAKALSFEAEERDRYAATLIEQGQQTLLNRQAENPDNWQEVERQGEELIRNSGRSPIAQDVELREWRKKRALQLYEVRRVRGEAAARAGLVSGGIYSAMEDVESTNNPSAESDKGASGIMQVMPGTAREIAAELGDPNFPADGTDEEVKEYLKNEANGRAYGRHYFDKMLNRYDGDVEAALVAYNGGPERANDWLAAGRDDSVLPKETSDYYKKVLKKQPTFKDTGRTLGQSGPSSARDFLLSRTDKDASHIDGMDASFGNKLASLIQAAPPGIAEHLGVYSGARSVEHQERLWNAALKKYGSAAAARKWVAPPGKSNHNHGRAADLSYKGQSLAKAPPEVVNWVHEHAKDFGLKFPLANENWHIEDASTRGGDKGHKHGDVQGPDVGYSILSDPAPEYAALDFDTRLKLYEDSLAREKKAASEMSAQARAAIEIATANAPVAIQNTGVYSGVMPTPEMFISAYGEDGGQRYNEFATAVETSEQAYRMQSMSTGEIRGMIEDAAPVSSGDNAALENERYEILSKAADATIKAREADPVSYVRRLYPHVEQAWQESSTATGGYQQAFAATIAAQEQLGIRNMQMLPNNVAETAVNQFKDVNLSEAERMSTAAGLVMATADPEQQRAIFEQLVEAGLPDMTEGAFVALSRGDEGAARRLFQAAAIDPEKLPGKLPGDVTKPQLSAAIQSELMDEGQIGDIYYGITDGTMENFVRAERDNKLIMNSVILRMMNGETEEAAIASVAKDLYGDVKPVEGDGRVNARILVPIEQDEDEVIEGLHGLIPSVRSAIESELVITDDVPTADGTRAVLNAATSSYPDLVISEGFFRNAGEGFVFWNPLTNLKGYPVGPVSDANGDPIIFTMEEVLASQPVRDERAPEAPLTDDAFDAFQRRMGQ